MNACFPYEITGGFPSVPLACAPPILNFSYKNHFSFTVVHDEQRYNKPFSKRPSMDLAVWDGTQQGRATTTKTLICPGWETAVAPVSQPGTPVRDKRRCHFVPGVATGTKEDLLSRLVTPTGTKGAASAHVAGAPFCPGWCYQPGQNVPFFSCFSFLNSFSISIILLHFN